MWQCVVGLCCCRCVYCLHLFFFKQKTAYEMRISDWSSDVCSSDLPTASRAEFIMVNMAIRPLFGSPTSQPCAPSKFITQVAEPWIPILCSRDRKSVV